MPLTLEVIGTKAANMGAAVRKTFTGNATIGRLRDNDWVFPDEYISGHHARISVIEGAFAIEDTSTNGVFVNSPNNRLTRGTPYVLRDGDTVFIDDYEVRVSLDAEPAAAAPYSAPSYGAPLQRSSSAAADPFGLGPSSESFDDADSTDPMKLLGLSDARPVARTGPRAADLANSSPLSQHYQPPSVAVERPSSPPAWDDGPAADIEPIPDDYDPLRTTYGVKADRAPPPAKRAPPPPPPPRPTVADDPPRTVINSPRVPNPGARPDRGPPRVPTGDTGRNRMPLSMEDPFAAAPPRNTPPGRDKDTVRVTPRGVRPGPTPVEPPVRRPVATAPVPSAYVRQPDPPPREFAAPPQSLESSDVRRVPPDRRQAAPAPTAPGPDPDFARMLAAAGVDASQVGAEFSDQFGQILRVVVEGLMDVLHARDRIKDEFRMSATTFKAVHNNPLKFSANVEDALHNLLVKRNKAFLGPVESFEDAFNDVRNHQMAMLAGIRVAYEAMLSEFDPKKLQADFDRHVKSGSLFSGLAKQKYWDLYSARFHDMVKDADASFRNLFGDDFARAYEEQLARLKATGRADR